MELEIDVREDLPGKIDIVLTDEFRKNEGVKMPCMLRMMSSVNNMTDMCKTLGNVITPGAQWAMFCSALQFSLWYKGLTF